LSRKRTPTSRTRRSAETARRDIDLPFSKSVGYQIRCTHRALQRYLQLKIEPRGVTLGMWYFLRALWSEDGLTQRELSRRVGTMEPTTLNAILTMERCGFVRRERNKKDRRKSHVFLTAKGRNLKGELIPLAKEVVDMAVQGLSAREVMGLLSGLTEIQRNLQATISQLDEIESRFAE
jgi:MarR family transcriptional regulator, organic hydroperoxide resistance regulator